MDDLADDEVRSIVSLSLYCEPKRYVRASACKEV